ncbi:MAG TPA: MlaD family protein [Gammaproteobacteria bacterium]|nr:MlaD family protein [Gammaproteobacteria bacterium]
MKRENINYMVVGVFVLIMLGAFFVVMYKITGRTGPADEYYVVYDNVAGIKYGTLVLYEGYQVGQVEDIQPVKEEGRTRYRLSLSIEKDWTIPDDSVAQIVASGLLAAITIDIEEGESKTTYSPGDTIRGKEAESIFTAVNEVATDLTDLSRNSIRPLIDNLDSNLQTLVDDLTDLTSNHVRPLVDNVNQNLDQKVFPELNTVLNKLNTSADRLLVLLDEDNQQNIENILVNLDSASGSLDELVQRIEGTRIAMDAVLLNIHQLVESNEENVSASVEDLRKSLDVVSMNINSIIHHMETSSRNFNELSRELRENPGLLLRSTPQQDAGVRE